MGLFDDVDVAAVVAACEARSNRKKPSRPRKGLDAIRGIVQKMPDGKAVFSAEIVEAIWDHPDRSIIWPKVKSKNGLAKVVGDLLGKGGLGLERDKKGAFIIKDPLPEVTQQAVSVN